MSSSDTPPSRPSPKSTSSAPPAAPSPEPPSAFQAFMSGMASGVKNAIPRRLDLASGFSAPLLSAAASVAATSGPRATVDLASAAYDAADPVQKKKAKAAAWQATGDMTASALSSAALTSAAGRG